MVAIPATAILLTNLDFWEKIRAVCKIVAEQRTALARSWSRDPFVLEEKPAHHPLEPLAVILFKK